VSCSICFRFAPQGRRTCGELACVSEYHRRAMKKLWSDPERRKAQSVRICAAKKADRLLRAAVGTTKEGRVLIN